MLTTVYRPQLHPLKAHQYGLNLIELIIVLAIAAFLIAIAAPSFDNVIARNNVIAEANRIVSSINHARSEAVNKQQVVTLSRNSTTARDWSDGWTTYIDSGGEGNQNLSNGDLLLKEHETTSAQITINTDSDGDQWISFDASGRLIETGNVRIAVCDTDLSNGFEGRLIDINLVGRTQIVSITQSAGNCAP